MGLAGQDSRADQRGYAMAALLVGMSVMAVMMAAALPVWSHAARREREAELIWRGEQYKRAIMLFQRKYANTFPPTVDILVEQRFLRKKYKDPITGDDFQLIPVGGTVPGMPGGGAAPGAQATNTAFGAGSMGPAAQGPGGAGAGGFGGAAQTGGGGFGGGFGGGGRAGVSGLQTSTQMPGASGGFAQMTPSTQPSMGIQGVTSKSKDQSIKLYNGMDHYNQWAFVYLAASGQAGAGGVGFRAPGQGAAGVNQPGAMGNPGAGRVNQGGFGNPGTFGQPVMPPVPGGGFGTPGGIGTPQQPGGFGQPGGGFGTPPPPGSPPPGGSIFTPNQPGQQRPPFGAQPPSGR